MFNFVVNFWCIFFWLGSGKGTPAITEGGGGGRHPIPLPPGYALSYYRLPVKFKLKYSFAKLPENPPSIVKIWLEARKVLYT